MKDVGGTRELYDVRADPDQTHNIYGKTPELDERLAGVLSELRTCKAQSCREADRASIE